MVVFRLASRHNSGMSQSLARNLIHLIYSTKDRAPIIRDEIRVDLHAYAVRILTDEGCFVLAINSVRDHMHILFELNKTIALATAIQHVKQGTSRWINELSAGPKLFAWQNGYGAFSVSVSNAEQVIDYIAGQEEHHRKLSFKDELLAFLKKHNVKYNEEFLWS
jgi:putative transposase